MINFDLLTESQVGALAHITSRGGAGQGLYRQTARSLVDRELIVAIDRVENGWRWREYRIPRPVAEAFGAWWSVRELATVAT